MKKIAFIGYGLRAQTMMNSFRTMQAPFMVSAIADPRCRELEEDLKDDPFFTGTVYYESAEEMLRNEHPDGVFIGTKASAEFDFYTGDLRIDYYEWERSGVQHFTYPSPMHFGGDAQLALAFMDVLDGRASRCTLNSGLASAAACLAAKKAAETQELTPIYYGFDPDETKPVFSKD